MFYAVKVTSRNKEYINELCEYLISIGYTHSDPHAEYNDEDTDWDYQWVDRCCTGCGQIVMNTSIRAFHGIGVDETDDYKCITITEARELIYTPWWEK